MVTLRMIWIAVAILLGIPLATVLADHAPGHIQVPGGEIFRATAEEAATITDIVLADPPRTYERAVIDARPEQLVEGHIVFITIDIPLIANVSNFTVDIVGNVSCELHSNASGPIVFGIPIPNRVHELHEECEAGGVVFVTPDPFVDSESTPVQTALQPNGNVLTMEAPNGERVEATEYEYDIVETDWLGNKIAHHMYAWSVPTITPWTHTDGGEKRWYCPIPEARLKEMGVTDFIAYHESELPDRFR